MKNYLKLIHIDEYSVTPKYRQVSQAILQGIARGQVQGRDLLPSINDLSTALDISRRTVERAYTELKKSGAVEAVPGKGYFIAAAAPEIPIRVLLLFNKLSSHKKIIYDAFAEKLGAKAAIDFYIYNNSAVIFKKLLSAKVDQYDKIVVIPHFTEQEESIVTLLNTLPKEQLILLDKRLPGLKTHYSAVYEDFEKDIYGALEQLQDRLSHYHTIKLIFPDQSYYAKEIITGFTRFCRSRNINYQIIPGLEEEKLQAGNVYINLAEEDLVTLIEKALDHQLKPGREIGVISYNETPVKKLILDGITTISTDFKQMGEQAAALVLANQPRQTAIPFRVILRKSV